MMGNVQRGDGEWLGGDFIKTWGDILVGTLETLIASLPSRRLLSFLTFVGYTPSQERYGANTVSLINTRHGVLCTVLRGG